MSLAKLAVLGVSVVLALTEAYFLYHLSARWVPADFVRPFLAIFLSLMASPLLIKAHLRKVALLTHFLVGFVLSLISTLTYFYYRSIDAVFTSDDVVAIAQSNSEEVYDFLCHYILNGTSLAASVVLFLIYVVLFVWFLLLWGQRVPEKRIPYSTRSFFFKRSRRVMLAVSALILVLSTVAISTQLRPVKHYRLMTAELEGKLEYFHQIVAQLEKSATHQATKVNADGQGELYVLITLTSRDFDP